MARVGKFRREDYFDEVTMEFFRGAYTPAEAKRATRDVTGCSVKEAAASVKRVLKQIDDAIKGG